MILATQDHIEAYRRMLWIRRFEEAVIEQHAAGAIPGVAHCSIGKEAAIVGAGIPLATARHHPPR